MKPILLILGAIGALLGLIVYSLQSKPLIRVDEGACRVPEAEHAAHPECFFSDGYQQARGRFLDAAERAGAEVLEMEVTEGLSTQVAILRGNPRRYLVHLSGTHGVEAYAGSAIQLAALKALHADPSQPTMVFVHAVNPFGFQHNRRVNEDNVDLNRNFLSNEGFAFVRSRHPNYAHYEDLDGFLNPTSKPTGLVLVDELLCALANLWEISRHDAVAVKKAMVSGNYHKPKGVGFGGIAQSRSVSNLLALLTSDTLDLPHMADDLVLIDVHTGLGPEGVDTLMFNHTTDLEDIFPTEMDGQRRLGMKANTFTDKTDPTAAAVAAGFELTVGTTEDICRKFLTPALSSDHSLCICQEFGTVAPLIVGKNVVDENYAFHWGSAAEKGYYNEQSKHCFTVQSRGWKRSIVQRGLAVINQAIAHLRR